MVQSHPEKVVRPGLERCRARQIARTHSRFLLPGHPLRGGSTKPVAFNNSLGDPHLFFLPAPDTVRFAICGPSGSGKTYTLQLATELGGPVALIDTERGSASKYADLFEFDVLELESYDPARLIEIINEAARIGYRVVCIDSLSHFWIGKDGELDKVDRAARRMQTPNSFAAWKQVTPLHNALIDKIVSAPLPHPGRHARKDRMDSGPRRTDRQNGSTESGTSARDARWHRIRVRCVRRHGPGKYAPDH